jgi:hypothetical protein
MDIVSALVGGGLALFGALMTQRMTTKREAERHERERAERHERELKLAYVEWLTANQHAIVVITAIAAMPKEKQDGMAILDKFSSDIGAAGSKVRVLETDQRAREKVAEAMQIIATFGAKVGTNTGGFTEVLKEVADATFKLGEVERWVLANRFPPTTGALTQPPARDDRPRLPSDPAK